MTFPSRLVALTSAALFLVAACGVAPTEGPKDEGDGGGLDPFGGAVGADAAGRARDGGVPATIDGATTDGGTRDAARDAPVGPMDAARDPDEGGPRRDAAPDACRALSCAELGATCGAVGDGCGRTLQCGTCSAPATCGGGGVPRACGCTATTCAARGASCGAIPDGCGGALACGTCAAGETCGGGSTPNVCGRAPCRPTTCAAQGARCGTVSDGCGAVLQCGTCAAPRTCGGGGAPNVCGCTRTTCAAEGKDCGSIQDGCGGTLACGACLAPATCGGAGAPNVCACAPTTCAAQRKNCGSIPDGCGGTLDCGGCPTGHACGLGGPNVCACRPRTCVEAGATCGAISDGCGGTLTCGTCAGDLACTGNATCSAPLTPVPGGVCSVQGWCWELPAPIGNALRAAFTVGSDTWVVGDEGTVARGNAAGWSGVTGLIPRSLTGVWAAASNDVWIVGAFGTVLRSDGATLRQIPVPVSATARFTGVWGTGANDVWLVHEDGLLHWDGSLFESRVVGSATGDLNGVWSATPGDVYVAADGGIYHSGPNGFVRELALSGSDDAYAVGGAGGAIWALGSNGAVWRRVGGTWNRGTVGSSSSAWRAIVATSPTQATIVGHVAGTTYTATAAHFDGVSWTASSVGLLGSTLFGVTRNVAGQPLAVGAAIFTWAGAQWTPVGRALPLPGSSFDSGALVANAPDDVWAIDQQGVAHWNGTAWVDRSTALPANHFARAASGVRPGVVYVVANGRVHRWNGSAFVAMNGTPTNAVSVFAAGSEVWAAVPGGVQRWDAVGDRWVPEVTPIAGTSAQLRDFSGSETDLFAVGPMLRRHNGVWSEVAGGPSNPLAVLRLGPGEVWVSGNQTLLRWNGGSWSGFASSSPRDDMRSFAARSATDVWAVGYDVAPGGSMTSMFFHWDGVAWTRRTGPAQFARVAFDGTSMWASSGAGRVVRLRR